MNNKSSVVNLDASTIISNKTLIALIRLCVVRDVRPENMTLFECGMQEQKRLFAQAIQQEFNIDTGLNNAEHLIKSLRPQHRVDHAKYPL